MAAASPSSSVSSNNPPSLIHKILSDSGIEEEVVFYSNDTSMASSDGSIPTFGIHEPIAAQLDAFLVDPYYPTALVTSGGTSVPLDGVRSLENFSTGLRGAMAVEVLLSMGYRVVHLTRKGSAAPFERQLRQYLQQDHGGSTWANLFSQKDTDDLYLTENDGRPVVDVQLDARFARRMEPVLELERSTRHRLLVLEFVTVHDYLGLLETCCTALQGYTPLLILAAAVSDYWMDKAAHKIQSGSDSLVLELQPVPKTLGLVRNHWCPDGFLVSFKLETDESILRRKATRAMETYGSHAVVANVLETRYEMLWILQNTLGGEPTWRKITKPNVGDDALEHAWLDVVCEAHLEHISEIRPSLTVLATHVKRQAQGRAERARQRRLKLWSQAQGVILEVAGALMAMAISHVIHTTLQRRLKS